MLAGGLLVPVAARAASAISTNHLIVPGVSIGPVSLGESQDKVAAIAGPEHHIVSQGKMVHEYRDLQL